MAYVCDLNAEETRQYRGTLTEPGKNSPWRDRTIEENLDLFGRMRAGEFPDGSRTLRARIDMASPNLNMRDPVMYRILRASHHRTGDKWCIYPMYDFTHGQSDSIEKITHSLCTLEFEDHRPLYDWFLDQLEIYHPQQTEFARLELTHTIMSKRKLLALVNNSHVTGWEDPRMPTICGLRRRGYTPESIRTFADKVGVARRRDSIADIALLEHCLREDLNLRAPRVMAVLCPLKVTITNYPEDQVEQLEAVNNPEDESMGSRTVPFSRELYVERDDFRDEPHKKWFRLAPGKEVRLKHAYFITCEEVIRDESGEVIELRCKYDPDSRGGASPDGRKVRGTLHWVSAAHAIVAEVRLYDHLFASENPAEIAGGSDLSEDINPDSLIVLNNCKVEPSLSGAERESRYQFMRHGYFCVDNVESTGKRLVFNRTVTLRDSWAKIEKMLSK
ncbi:MAG: glutamine--tRNA ligase, partial [Candidatus Zixiibacteriota bacterium]